MKHHRISKTILIASGLAAICFPQLATAQGNLVYNGGFNANSDGWTLIYGAYYNSKNGDPAPDVVLGLGKAAASQTINGLTPGVTYNVFGDYQDIDGGSATVPGFGVALNGVYMFEAVAPPNSDWYSFNFDYIASSSSALLSLSQINGSGIYYSIDNIVMQAVPEPASLMSIVFGSGALLYLARFRRA
jgi:hypothetical protein